MSVRNVTVEVNSVRLSEVIVNVIKGGTTVPVNATLERRQTHRDDSVILHLDNGIQLGLDSDWYAVVEREHLLATYYFRNNPCVTTDLYTSGILFDNASAIVDEDGYVHKAKFQA